jgi:sortase A
MKRRWVEYCLLFSGLIALDYFVWVNASSDLLQAYESWSFERDLTGQKTSVRGFLVHEWDSLTGQNAEVPAAEGKSGPTQEQPDQQMAPLQQRSVIGRVEIPRLKLSVMIREGVDTGTLMGSVGHIPSTSLPGGAGNVALAAHRDTYFLPLEHIENGDLIEVKTLQASFQYVVESTQVVRPKDVWVLKASNHPTLTLVTCFPFRYIGAAPQRFIVRATQVGKTLSPAVLDSLSLRPSSLSPSGS